MEPNFNLAHVVSKSVSATHLDPGAAGLVSQPIKVGSLRSQAGLHRVNQSCGVGGPRAGKVWGECSMDHVVY